MSERLHTFAVTGLELQAAEKEVLIPLARECAARCTAGVSMEVRGRVAGNTEVSGDTSGVFEIDSVLSGPVRIEMRLPAPMPVDLRVFDVAGREVSRIANGPFAAGERIVTWDPPGDLDAGIYFARMKTPAGTVVRRIGIVR